MNTEMNLNVLSENDLLWLKEKISSSNHIVITGHSRPDGDAMGSCLAWAACLREAFGKEPAVIMPNAYPDFLQWLPGTHAIIRYDKHPEKVTQALNKADLLFCIDFNDNSRVDTMAEILTACQAPRVLFDHHLGPQMQADVKVSSEEFCSASEVVFRAAWQLGVFDKLSKTFAVCDYCGMMTDTGGFTFASSRPEIFYIICQLLTKGIDKDKIYRNVFNNYSTWAIRLRGYLMSQKLNVFEDIHASYYTLTRQNMLDFYYKRGDAEGLVNEPLRIKGMKVSVSLREDDRIDNKIWVSLRSVDDFSVEDMARRFFNGGGHFNASGGHLDCSIEEAEKITREAFTFYREQLKG